MNGTDIKSHFTSFEVSQNMTRSISGLSIDTRTMKVGDLFFAIHGENFDSHSVIDEAILKGASGIVLEDDRPIPETLLKIKVPNSRTAYALISSLFFDFPSEKLKLVGITGTSGKTTTAFLLYDLFNKLGINAGFIGTLGVGINGQFVRMELFPPTTPNAFHLNRILSEMISHNVEYVFLEVTSHGIKQKRVYGLRFAYKVLTTIGIDHLDYHRTYEDYLNTKLSFFEGQDYTAILNRDSREFNLFDFSCKARKFTYGILNKADLIATDVKLGENFSSFLMNVRNEKSSEIKLLMGGLFNVYNFLAVSSLAFLENVSLEAIKAFAIKVPAIAGRLEYYRISGRTVIVDFAHNPIEIGEVLKFLKTIKGVGRLITVVGSVGGSTLEKRIEIGRAASRLSDYVFITTDDPRGDDINQLVFYTFKGVEGNGEAEPNRIEAIKKACKYSRPYDIIALLGRGDEQEMHYSEGLEYFRDIEIAQKAFDED